MSIVNRTWFFVTTVTNRFKSKDRPDEASFRNLTDSALFKAESDDRAKEDSASPTSSLNGHVVAATDAQAKANQAKKTDRTLVAQPSQLPSVVADASQSIGAFTGQSITVTIDPAVTTKNSFLVKVSDIFITYVNGLKLLLADFNDVNSKNTTDAVTSINLPQVSSVIFNSNPNTTTDYNGSIVSITEDPATSIAPYNKNNFKINTDFRTWLQARFTERPVPTPAADVAVAYVLYNASSPTSGTGSIISPYGSLSHALTTLASNQKSIIVLDSGDIEFITYTASISWSKNITISDGVYLYVSDDFTSLTSGDQIADPGKFLFTALNGFSITGNGTICLWNVGLVDITGNNLTTVTSDDITLLFNRRPIKKNNASPSLFNMTNMTINHTTVKDQIVKVIFVDLATTTNISLSGEQMIDGIMTSSSKVLVKDQTTGSSNGVYQSGSGAWSRTLDANSDVLLIDSTFKVKNTVSNGTVNRNKVFTCNNTSIILEATTITFIPKATPPRTYLSYNVTTICNLAVSGSNYARWFIDSCTFNNVILDIVTSNGYGSCVRSYFYSLGQSGGYSYIHFAMVNLNNGLQSLSYNFTSRDNTFDMGNRNTVYAIDASSDYGVSINDRIIRLYTSGTVAQDITGNPDKLYAYNLFTSSLNHGSPTILKSGSVVIPIANNLTIV
jgi:hypothetical protein